ncbi:carbamoyltransferase HypF [Butyrivibrio sp. XPD2006]|uniref:carbamoyltransferase HypF n=1 Tax=Butyrivibrio sp. XPD2006 TaxID=1280668 RepID=UPI0003B37770|nr:carbamoyltransferase HypF [Butyrivibrio sp. XPD2006]
MIKIITVKGAVQGVGYRPFIAEKATEYGFKGYVKNIGAAVEILISGKEADIASFICLLEKEMPQGAYIISVNAFDAPSDTEVPESFLIIESSEINLNDEIPVFLPDIGICNDCMNELLDKGNRRYRHPLISCAVCGPRFSILNSLPYDRDTTTMIDFDMCHNCLNEYGKGRRHYAQTISCHDCGPQMKYVQIDENDYELEFEKEDAVGEAINDLKAGKIIGLKGVSGYQLVCVPTSEAAALLRKVKGRENKPFAVMFSSVEAASEAAYISEKEKELLESSERPIVLIKKKTEFPFEVDKGSSYIGAFLPSAGIHRILCDAVGPLIVSSGNRSGNPIIFDDELFRETFLDKIGGILYHDRKINIAQDDSVVFTINIGSGESTQFIRRARGYAPLPFVIEGKESFAENKDCVLAVGGDLKNTISYAKKDRVLTTHYISDLSNDIDIMEFWNHVKEHYEKLFSLKPTVVVSDLHPLYASSYMASKMDLKQLRLQHHFAHIYSVMAENGLSSALGAAFDGTGYGEDAAIWGGEFVFIDECNPSRKGHLSYVNLVGGDEAAKNAVQTMNCYIGQCIGEGMLDEALFPDNKDLKMMMAAQKVGAGAFRSSSMGRLFDAVSALLDVCSYNTYEGECAVNLEKCAQSFITGGVRDYPKFEFIMRKTDEGLVFDQVSLFKDIYMCYNTKAADRNAIAYGFHMAVVDMIIRAFTALKKETGLNTVCLSGGVFNNRIILGRAAEELKRCGFEVYWNRKVPLGDGGISLGQAYYAMLTESTDRRNLCV